MSEAKVILPLSSDLEDESSSNIGFNLDIVPVNIIVIDNDGKVNSVNKKAADFFKSKDEALSIPEDKIVNSYIYEIWDKLSEYNYSSNGNNLPRSLVLPFGNDTLEISIEVMRAKSGDSTIVGNIITWNVITERMTAHRRAEVLKQMLHLSPVNIMMADPDGVLTYLNKSARFILSSLEESLPCKVDDMVGSNIAIFHKHPEKQAKIIADPNNFPLDTLIAVGGHHLLLKIVAIKDHKNEYVGPLVAWEVVTEKIKLIDNLKESSDMLSNAADKLLATSDILSVCADDTSEQAQTANTVSSEVSSGVNSMTHNMQEMSDAITDINTITDESSKISSDTLDMAKKTSSIINDLTESSKGIGNVISAISSIAQQTNLLALNATIEAARAGEAGKGFAVVANEVKELAKQTSGATQDIISRIEKVQENSTSASEAIDEIMKSIDKINNYSGNVAVSIQQQLIASKEVNRIVSESAESVNQINENINQVSISAEKTGTEAMSTKEAAKELMKVAELLSKYIEEVKVQ